MSQWNNPDGKGYGQIGTNAVDVVFDVSVEAVTTDEADRMAADNKNTAVNFMALVEGGGPFTEENSGKFDINQVENDGYGSTNAAHEFGHMLGYFNDKGVPESR